MCEKLVVVYRCTRGYPRDLPSVASLLLSSASMRFSRSSSFCLAPFFFTRPPPPSWIPYSPFCFKNFSTASSVPLFPPLSPSTNHPLLQTSDGQQPQVLLSSFSFLSCSSLSRPSSSFSPLLRPSPLSSSVRTIAQRSSQADWLSKTSRRTMATDKSDNAPIVPYDPENVFKKIIEGKIPCHKVIRQILSFTSSLHHSDSLIEAADNSRFFSLRRLVRQFFSE